MIMANNITAFKHRRGLFVNFVGQGNALSVIPLLYRLELVAPEFKYFHIDNHVFHIEEMRPTNIVGLVPAHWRRFSPCDWPTITKFLKEEKIDVIINVRNEGPSYDVNYFNFKKMFGSRLAFLDFFDLFESHSAIPRSISQQIVDLFRQNGLDLSQYDRSWLKRLLTKSEQANSISRENRIGFFTGVSQSVKAFPLNDWCLLGAFVLNETKFELNIYAGNTRSEGNLAAKVHAQLCEIHGASRCRLVSSLSLTELAKDLLQLRLVVTNDTAITHLAAALDLKTVALYFSTDHRIWGYDHPSFRAVQSQMGLACSFFKPGSGNCERYYSGCYAPCKNEVTPERVFRAISELLSDVLPSATPQLVEQY
jgi:ADP-heptose:LPS heptosyltransferase